MARKLQILFRRDPKRNRQLNNVDMDGFQLLWPDRRPVESGFDAFCRHTQRALGLHRHMEDVEEQLMELIHYPRNGREDSLVRIPGQIVRRLMVKREGVVGRLHLLNGAPTEITFEMGRDDPRLLNWVGLPELADGEERWFDLKARPVRSAVRECQSSRR
jgi:hypothetical protein